MPTVLPRIGEGSYRPPWWTRAPAVEAAGLPSVVVLFRVRLGLTCKRFFEPGHRPLAFTTGDDGHHRLHEAHGAVPGALRHVMDEGATVPLFEREFQPRVPHGLSEPLQGFEVDDVARGLELLDDPPEGAKTPLVPVGRRAAHGIGGDRLALDEDTPARHPTLVTRDVGEACKHGIDRTIDALVYG